MCFIDESIVSRVTTLCVLCDVWVTEGRDEGVPDAEETSTLVTSSLYRHPCEEQHVVARARRCAVFTRPLQTFSSDPNPRSRGARPREPPEDFE
jgi:hypothetical protein